MASHLFGQKFYFAKLIATTAYLIGIVVVSISPDFIDPDAIKFANEYKREFTAVYLVFLVLDLIASWVSLISNAIKNVSRQTKKLWQFAKVANGGKEHDKGSN